MLGRMGSKNPPKTKIHFFQKMPGMSLGSRLIHRGINWGPMGPTFMILMGPWGFNYLFMDFLLALLALLARFGSINPVYGSINPVYGSINRYMGLLTGKWVYYPRIWIY